MQSVLGDAISIMVWPSAALPAAISIGACTATDYDQWYQTSLYRGLWVL